MPTRGSGRGINVSETEKRVIIQVHDDRFEAYVDDTFITAGEINAVTHDIELDRDLFPRLSAGTEVRIMVSDPHSWSGRLSFHGDVFEHCPRCDIDPKDCGEHV